MTEEGAERTRRAARGVACLEPGVRKVFASPALRTLASARLLSEALELHGEPEVLSSLAPDGVWRETLKQLSREAEDANVALVGHEPGLGVLAASLLLSAEVNALSFKKAGACAIECDVPELGRGRLRWWLRPAALRAMRPHKNKKGRVG